MSCVYGTNISANQGPSERLDSRSHRQGAKEPRLRTTLVSAFPWSQHLLVPANQQRCPPCSTMRTGCTVGEHRRGVGQVRGVAYEIVRSHSASQPHVKAIAKTDWTTCRSASCRGPLWRRRV
eukprot:scaffold151841_cov33-Tisochrysis_lutea.AAC.4